ncbi:MAG: PAS domain-containing protein [Mariprofundaceae bacterium]|nr:PAS domain-containing protein [Mariprofundaceae bacterium]
MDGLLIYVNPAYANIVGYSSEETLHLSYWDLTPIKYEPQEAEQLEQLSQTGSYGPYENEYIHQKGHLVNVRLNGTIIEIDGNQYIWSSVENIDDMKWVESALRRNDRALNRAEEIANMGSWTWDLEEGDIYWSDHIYRLFGLDPQSFEVSYKSFFSHVHPDDRRFVESEINLALEGVKRYNIDHRVIQKNGDVIMVHEQAGVERNAAGDAIAMHSTVQNVTKVGHDAYSLKLF